MKTEKIAAAIDHAVLKPTATLEDVKKGAEIAIKYNAASLCVRPSDLPEAKEYLRGSNVILSTVIGFPHGTTSSLTKVSESLDAINNGAKELDIVLNIPRLKSGDLEYVKSDLVPLIKYANQHGSKTKIIIESCYLTDEEIVTACNICNEIKPNWIKTSTGFGSGGATYKTIELIKKHIDPSIQIKASGGIKNREMAETYLEMGCTRLGLSGTEGILNDQESTGY